MQKDLCVCVVKVDLYKGNHLYNLCRAPVIDAACQVSIASDFWFWGKILKVFIIYGRGDHLGYVTWAIFKNVRSSFPGRLQMKFGFD